MANCIVRKLRESLPYDDLYPLDTLVFQLSTSDKFRLVLQLHDISKQSIITTTGSVKIYTDYTDENSIVDSYNITYNHNGTECYIYFSGIGNICIGNKQNIKQFSAANVSGNTNCGVINLKDICGIPLYLFNIYHLSVIGDIKYIGRNDYRTLQKIFMSQKLSDNYLKISGNINTIIDKLNYPLSGIQIRSSDNSLYGDLTDLLKIITENAIATAAFTFVSEGIYGDTSKIQNNNTIASLSVTSSSFNAYIDDLKKCTSANVFSFINFIGNLAELPASCAFITTIYLENLNNYCIWGSSNSRPSSSNIIALENIKFLDSDQVDNMLINQANCTFNPVSSSTWHKTIRIYGANRTSASDTAVTTLKSKGIIIIINDITQ